ncbi:MAG: hypothetical protein Q9188_000877 [Gyalolechia gomerana]
MVLFGDGSVAQVVLSAGQRTSPGQNGSGNYQSISWGEHLVEKESDVAKANYRSGIDNYEGIGVRTVPPSPTATAGVFCTYPQEQWAKAAQAHFSLSHFSFSSLDSEPALGGKRFVILVGHRGDTQADKAGLRYQPCT